MTPVFSSVSLKRLLVVLVALLVLVSSFYAGITVGVHRAQRALDWCENYGHLFDRHSGFGAPLFNGPPPGLPGDHGAFGTVLSISGDTLVLNSDDNLEQTVQVTSSTTIRIGHTTGSLTDVQLKDRIAVFGSPNSAGRIEARLIRVFSTSEDATPEPEFESVSGSAR